MEFNKVEIEKCIFAIDRFNLSERKYVHDRYFSMGGLQSNNVNEKLMLYSLVSFVYIKMKEKNPTIRVIDILKQITKTEPNNDIFYQYLENLSIICEDLSSGCTTSDTCGLKTVPEIIAKIKSILETWLPF